MSKRARKLTWEKDADTYSAAGKREQAAKSIWRKGSLGLMMAHKPAYYLTTCEPAFKVMVSYVGSDKTMWFFQVNGASLIYPTNNKGLFQCYATATQAKQEATKWLLRYIAKLDIRKKRKQ